MKPLEDMLAGIAELPAPLRAVVEAELAAGNEVAEVIHGHPVPPVGVGVRLVRALSVALPSAAAAVRPCQFPAWDGSSGYSDEPKHNFVLGPPAAPSDPVPMDEIRGAGNQPRQPVTATDQPRPRPAADTSSSALARFEQSLHIDYEKWHDGTGYDLDAIREAFPEERASIEDLLLERGVRDWRDVEALAVLKSPRAREALRAATSSNKQEVALALVRHAPDLLTEAERVAIIMHGLEQAAPYGGLTQVLALIEGFHPPPVIEALLRETVRREGEVAIRFAAMLMFLHGRAETAFDWEQRPFFLTFNGRDKTAREAAFRELCRKIEVEPQPYLELS